MVLNMEFIDYSGDTEGHVIFDPVLELLPL